MSTPEFEKWCAERRAWIRQNQAIIAEYQRQREEAWKMPTWLQNTVAILFIALVAIALCPEVLFFVLDCFK